MEKPFGSDTVSADKLNRVLTRLVPEDQIHRVDHYLGMSTVLNILGLRYTGPGDLPAYGQVLAAVLAGDPRSQCGATRL